MSVCSTCYQLYNLMIRFECNHLLCLHCFQALPNTKLPFKCTSCEKTTQTFRYKFQKVLTCDLCDLQKSVEEFWWCDDCCQTVCSLCAMRGHKNCDTSHWDDMRIWKFYLAETETRLQRLVQDQKHRIEDFLARLRQRLFDQIDKSAKETLGILAKDDTAMSSTFAIAEPRNREAQAIPIGDPETQRQRTKKHLQKLLENLRFAGKPLKFDLELLHFIPPEVTCLDARFQELNVDGDTEKTK